MPRAEWDPDLVVRVVSRRPLFYARGADSAEDRPAHVRAGSGLAWWGERLAVIQDDARFVALVDPRTGEVEPVALPPGPDGLRLHDDTRGTKALKLDLECCVVIGPALIALGSGSTGERERIVVLEEPAGRWDVRVVEARSFYAALRSLPALGAGGLNIEGIALVGDIVRLFHRGNGSLPDGSAATSATCDVSRAAFVEMLGGDGRAAAALGSVVTWDLGDIAGARFGFTDAVATAQDIVFLAAAESSPSTVDDGPVAGVALGRMAHDASRATLAPILAADGTAFLAKAEGLALDRDDPSRLWVVLDRDDPASPSELCELRLHA